jgi:hypothetical protein
LKPFDPIQTQSEFNQNHANDQIRGNCENKPAPSIQQAEEIKENVPIENIEQIQMIPQPKINEKIYPVNCLPSKPQTSNVQL